MIAKDKKKHKILFFLIALFIFLIIGAVILTLRKHHQYDFIAPRKGEIVEAIYGLGKVKTHRRYEIKLGVMTNVKKVFVKEGQFVQINHPLIQFTDSKIFHAPFNGTVTRIDFHEPDVILPHVTVMTLEDLSDKFIEVSLEQEAALRVSTKQKAHVLFESLRGEKFEGVVDTIFPKNDEFLVHIKVQNLGRNILPGMTADVTIDVNHRQNALLIPLAGLSNGQVLLLRENSKKIKVPVVIGSIDGKWAEVVKGDIRENDRVLMKKEME